MKSLLITMIAIIAQSSFSQVTLEEGDKAPDFTLTADDGRQVSLSGYYDKQAIVLYFYPKDFTSGCTKQACNFRDNISGIEQYGAVVLGVSIDNAESHKKFKEEHNLNFTLLADTTKAVSQQYSGLNQNGSANRVTFIIDKSGIIRKIYQNVNVNENYAEIIEYLKGM